MPSPAQTVECILNAAEALFAEKGYDGASFRDITKKAGVNLAAAHYHLGDKETLFALVLQRRLRPINERRLAKLKDAEAQADGQPVPLSQILEIMAAPFFELCADPANGGAQFARILGRSLADPLPFMDALLEREFHPATARFAQAIRRHAPQLSPEDFLWRVSFVIGALHHTLANLHRMQGLTRGICRNHDHEGALLRFIHFAAAAFTAPGVGLPAFAFA